MLYNSSEISTPGCDSWAGNPTWSRGKPKYSLTGSNHLDPVVLNAVSARSPILRSCCFATRRCSRSSIPFSFFFPKANYLMFSVTEIHCLPERRGSVTGQTSPQFDRAGMTLPAVPSSSSLCLSEPVKSDWDREKINGFSGHCFKNKSRVDEQNITLLFEQKANICQERTFQQASILRSVFADLPL